MSSTFLVSSQPAYLGALVADNANSAAVFDVCKNYHRVVTEGYREDPWATPRPKLVRIIWAGHPAPRMRYAYWMWDVDQPCMAWSP